MTCHLLALEYLGRIGASAVGTGMTMVLGAVCHRSSLQTVSLDSTLEAFALGDSSCIDLIACCKRVSLDPVSYTHLDVYKRQP